MDTLNSLLILETCNGKENWLLAVEDPKDSSKTRIFQCKEREAQCREVSNSHKKGGHWKFKAFRFKGEVEKVEIKERSITQIWHDIPKDCFRQISINELKKLKEWTD